MIHKATLHITPFCAIPPNSDPSDFEYNLAKEKSCIFISRREESWLRSAPERFAQVQDHRREGLDTERENAERRTGIRPNRTRLEMDDFEGFLAQREASPLEYDPLDSASSSGSGSGDHSSPGDANLPSNPNWPNFSIVQLGAKQQRWSDHTQPPVDPENSIALTADFWSTAPSTTAHSPATTLGPATTLDPKMDYHYDEPINQRDIKVEQPHFDPNSIAPDSVFYPALALSMPLDLAAVDAGISPHLTGGLPSPDIPVRPLPLESTEQPAVASSSRLHSREASVAPAGQYVKEEDDDDVGASSRRPSVIATNLVTKEPVVASMVIPRLVAPAPSTLSAQSGLQMLVLGIPTVGAKSRVETQIKISVVLVRPTSEHGIDGNDLISLDGGIEAQAGEAFERIGSWTHIKIPQILAMRKKKLPKKLMKSGASPSSPWKGVTRLTRQFYRSTSIENSLPPGCRRSWIRNKGGDLHLQRLSATGAQTSAAKEGSEDSTDERRDWITRRGERSGSAETSRHLQQSGIRRVQRWRDCTADENHLLLSTSQGTKGILVRSALSTSLVHSTDTLTVCSVSFVFRNHLGAIVATGATPPIMITDDHKTSNTTRPLTDSADVKPKKKKVSRAPSPSLSEFIPAADRPKRNSRAKANRGMVDSDDEGSVVSNGPATTRASNGVTKKAKPYDSDARPRKRSIGVHKSPAFTMTPLPLSKANSPVLRPLSDSPLNSLPPLPTHFEIDPLAPGDCWTASGEWEAREDDSTMRDSQYSTGGSAAPSPAQSFGLTSPPFSPVNGGITVPHIVDSFSPYDPVPAHPLQQQQTYAYPSASAQVAYPHSPYDPSYIPSSSIFSNIAPPLAGSAWGFANPARPQAPAPRISRLIPGEGPVHGGIEVTVLGENFVRDLICVFGDSPAMTTHFWSSNTLICILPPSANPGPVVVGIKGLPLSVEEGNSLQLFTYKDDSDRSLLELALQVVGLKMTGRLEDAKNVARRSASFHFPILNIELILCSSRRKHRQRHRWTELEPNDEPYRQRIARVEHGRRNSSRLQYFRQFSTRFDRLLPPILPRHRPLCTTTLWIDRRNAAQLRSYGHPIPHPPRSRSVRNSRLSSFLPSRFRSHLSRQHATTYSTPSRRRTRIPPTLRFPHRARNRSRIARSQRIHRPSLRSSLRSSSHHPTTPRRRRRELRTKSSRKDRS